MTKFLWIIAVLVTNNALAKDISLTVEEYDFGRQRASILVVDSSNVPMGTTLRVHSKTGTCEVTITEKVNDHLVGITNGCEQGIITPGMKLAYSTDNNWDQPMREPAEISTSYDSPGLTQDILQRTTLFIGHNFAGELEGNVYNDGSVKNLDGDTAFSLGIKGRVYDFTERLSLAVELGYETPRTLDRATFTSPTGVSTVGGTQGFSPRLSLWTLAVLGEARLMERLNGFMGLNLSLPSVSNSQFDISSDIGFQGGANYQLFPQIAVEGLIKITNMNLKNNIGQTTDVSLAGLELRGRYSF